MREQGVALKNGIDVALVCGHPRHGLIRDKHFTFVGLLEPGDHPEAGGFATSRRTEQGNELTGLNRQRHVVHGRHGPKALRHPFNPNGTAATSHGVGV